MAWLSLIPTTAPALTADERGRIAAINRQATDDRTRARCALLLATRPPDGSAHHAVRAAVYNPRTHT
jgi:hypothetical protein